MDDTGNKHGSMEVVWNGNPWWEAWLEINQRTQPMVDAEASGGFYAVLELIVMWKGEYGVAAIRGLFVRLFNNSS